MIKAKCSCGPDPQHLDLPVPVSLTTCPLKSPDLPCLKLQAILGPLSVMPVSEKCLFPSPQFYLHPDYMDTPPHFSLFLSSKTTFFSSSKSSTDPAIQECQWPPVVPQTHHRYCSLVFKVFPAHRAFTPSHCCGPCAPRPKTCSPTQKALLPLKMPKSHPSTQACTNGNPTSS